MKRPIFFSEETRMKMRLSHLGKPSGRKGKKYGPQSAEQRRKSGDAVLRAYKERPEILLKISAALKGRKKPDGFGNRVRELKSGDKNHNWKGGLTTDKLYRSVYYKNWKAVNREKRYSLEKKRLGLIRITNTRFSKKEWVELKKLYNHMCLCCKKQEPFIKLTADHIVPIVMGGENSIDNIQPLCLSCNCRKHAKTIDYRKIYEQGT